MTSDDKCPRCGAGDLLLVSVQEDGETWELDTDPDQWDEGEEAEAWVCQNYVGRHGTRLCGWHEEATLAEQVEEHSRQIEWLFARLEKP